MSSHMHNVKKNICKHTKVHTTNVFSARSAEEKLGAKVEDSCENQYSHIKCKDPSFEINRMYVPRWTVSNLYGSKWRRNYRKRDDTRPNDIVYRYNDYTQ